MPHKKILIFPVLLLICLSFPGIAFSTPRGSVPVDSNQLFFIENNGKTIACAALNGRWVGGKLVDYTRQLFNSYRSMLKNKKRALRRTSNSAKQARLRKSITKIRTLKIYSDTACPNEAGGPTPSPSPSDSEPNFDSSGNVTQHGKIVFEIPLSLSASIGNGKVVFQNNCVGCHVERTNRTFTNLRLNTQKPPMYFDQNDLPDNDLANLTAYLNRYRLIGN